MSNDHQGAIQSGKKFGFGAPVRRIEDPALITGAGCFTDDKMPDGTLHGYVLRSNVAHAHFRLGGLDEARSAPDVHLILTAADLTSLGLIPCAAAPRQSDGSETRIPPYEVLCSTTVRHVGDAIAFIVAGTLEAATSAAELIEVDYDILGVVAGVDDAVAGGASLVWGDQDSNTAFTYETGDPADAEQIFSQARHVARIEIVNNRVVTNYMEPRAVIAECNPGGGYTVTLGSQGVHMIRETLAGITGIDPDQLTIVTPDVGGGFGTRAFMYREYPLAVVAAQRLGRPVKWVSDRNEHFLCCTHGRDHVSTAEMAIDEDGRFLALRVDIKANLGAYLSQYGAYVPMNSLAMATGVYDIACLHVRVRGIYTNTVPTDAYRGAGRPEAGYLIERMVDEAARVSGLSAPDIRRRNFIRPDQFPYKTLTGRVYDSGEYAAHLASALEKSDWEGIDARRTAARDAGKYRGIGFSVFVDNCSSGSGEPATVRLDPDGRFTILIGTQSGGQGHATAYAQVAAAHLGGEPSQFAMVQGDTRQVAQGGGTGGSRSIPLGAVSVDRAAGALAVKIKALASDELEAAVADLEIVAGGVRVVGTDRVLDLADVGRLAADPEMVCAEGDFTPESWTCPNGTHVCELDVDAETGAIEIVRYTVVDDFGATLNPLLLESQVQGGVGQGIGQALMERVVYDEDAQLLTGSFMDYAMPRAEEIPSIDFNTRNVPSPVNAMGMKGAGEAGAIASCPAVMNALVDALNHGCGVTQIDMPATPQAVWQAMSQGQRS